MGTDVGLLGLGARTDLGWAADVGSVGSGLGEIEVSADELDGIVLDGIVHG